MFKYLQRLFKARPRTPQKAAILQRQPDVYQVLVDGVHYVYVVAFETPPGHSRATPAEALAIALGWDWDMEAGRIRCVIRHDLSPAEAQEANLYAAGVAGGWISEEGV